MTEYDFSPEAYDHHLRTQARIARWVDQTETYRDDFGNEACQLVDPKWAQHRRAEPGYDGRPSPYRSLNGSPSTSSDDAYARHPLSPGPMPVMGLPAQLPVHQPEPRRPKTHRHQTSYSTQQPIYLQSPPTSPPVPGYGYGYNSMTGQVTSPGNTSQATAGSYFPQGIYAVPQDPGHRGPYTAPASTYPIYAPNTENPMQPSSTQYPYSSPPTIYPLTSSGAAPYNGSNYYFSSAKQDQTAKPVFYQKIFKDKQRSSKSGRSR